MTQRVATRELERQLRKEPENLPLRLRLAASYREAGRTQEAVQLYRSVAVAYHAQRRLAQAIAVCRSVLDIEPGQRETVALLAELEAMRGAEGESGSSPSAGVPIVSAASPDSGPVAIPPGSKQPTGPVPVAMPRTTTGAVGITPRTITGSMAAMRPVTGSMPAARPVTGSVPVAAPPIPAGPPPGARQPTGPVPVAVTGTTPPPRAGQDASSPGMPAVRMLEKDVSIRELTPVRTLARGPGPSIPPSAVGRRRPSTGPRPIEAGPPLSPAAERPSSPEDTPLPRPMPYHDVGDDSMVHMMPRPPAPVPPARSPRLRDLPPTLPAPTQPVSAAAAAPPPAQAQSREPRIRPGVGSGEARMPPPLPADVRGREPRPVERPPARQASSHDDAETHVASVDTPATPRLVPPLRAPIPMLDDEDAVTHVSGDWPLVGRPRPDQHRAPTRPVEALPSPMDMAADLDTRRMPRLSARELELLAGTTGGTNPGARPAELDDEPTRPPAAPLAAPEILARSSRPPDLEGPWAEEITDARLVSPLPLHPGDDADGALPGDDEVIPRDDDDDVIASVSATAVGLHASPLFQQPFAETLQGLGPDGSAIEAPSAGRLGVFSTLPDDVVAELERHMIVRRVAAGDIVLREGDRGESCFVIGSGEVRVLKSDPLGTSEGHGQLAAHGEPIEVARLGEGALFGEFALLADRRRHATVQAVTAGELYEIPRRLLRELAAGHPEVGPALERFYRARLLSTLLTTAPFFAPLPEDQRSVLLARFSPVHADAGQAIVVEGESAGGFYLIVLGAVDIMKRQSERRSLLLATLREGTYFGEMSLLTGHAASASVIAAGPVELARLGPKDFYEVVSANPRLWSAMRQEARHRELDNARFVAGDSSAV